MYATLWVKTNKGQHNAAVLNFVTHHTTSKQAIHSNHSPFIYPIFSPLIMVKTQEKSKGTHPGQVVAPKPQKSKEEVASEQAAKAAASKQKADEWLSRITGLASLKQRMMDECQQAMTHAARPPSSKARKIARTYSVHNLQSMQDSQSLLPGTRDQCQDQLLLLISCDINQ